MSYIILGEKQLHVLIFSKFKVACWPIHSFILVNRLSQIWNFILQRERSNRRSNQILCLVDPIEEQDANVLLGSVQEVLKASVMADADVLSEALQLLMHSAKDFSRRLWGLVPVGLYLPAPPLYCPQPAILSEVSAVYSCDSAEVDCLFL